MMKRGMMADLETQVGLRFRKTRYGSHPQAILEAIKRKHVVLREPDRQDTFKVSIEYFKKFYTPIYQRSSKTQ